MAHVAEPAKRRVSGPVAVDQDSMKKRAYETVLRDLFREEPSLRND